MKLFDRNCAEVEGEIMKDLMVVKKRYDSRLSLKERRGLRGTTVSIDMRMGIVSRNKKVRHQILFWVDWYD